jgi:hypothetical protein
MYDVTATVAAGNPNGPAGWACSVAAPYISSSAPHHQGASYRSSFPAGMAKTATGIVDGGGTGAIIENFQNLGRIVLLCKASTPNTVLYQADLTATQVSSVNGTTMKGKPAHRPITNHFARPQAARSQTRH